MAHAEAELPGMASLAATSLNRGAGRVGRCREAAVRGVLGVQQDRAAELDGPGQCGVGVLDPEVDRPVGGDIVGRKPVASMIPASQSSPWRVVV